MASEWWERGSERANIVIPSCNGQWALMSANGADDDDDDEDGETTNDPREEKE